MTGSRTPGIPRTRSSQLPAIWPQPEGARDIERGIFAYNHAQWYVDDVLALAATLGDAPFTAGPATLGAGPDLDLASKLESARNRVQQLSEALDRALGRSDSWSWQRLRIERRLGNPSLTDAQFAELDASLSRLGNAERASQAKIDRLRARFAQAVEALKKVKASAGGGGARRRTRGRRLRLPDRRRGVLLGELRRAPDDDLAPRDRHLRHARDTARGCRRRPALQRRVERRRREPALAAGCGRKRVLLRAPRRLLAARPGRRTGPGGRRDRLRRGHRRRGRDASAPPLRDPPAGSERPGLRRCRRPLPVPGRLEGRSRRGRTAVLRRLGLPGRRRGRERLDGAHASRLPGRRHRGAVGLAALRPARRGRHAHVPERHREVRDRAHAADDDGRGVRLLPPLLARRPG